jgi:hypothetical protein
LVEGIEQRSLLVNQKFRVADNVDEQDMANLQLNFFFNLGGHVPKADLRSRAPNHPIFAARVESKRIPRYVDLISDVLPFGRLWCEQSPDASRIREIHQK